MYVEKNVVFRYPNKIACAQPGKMRNLDDRFELMLEKKDVMRT